MSVRDLPAILRIIDGASTAHVIVVHIDHCEDVVSFNLSDLGPGAEASLKSVLHEVYLRRGRAAVMARLAGRRRRWVLPGSRSASRLLRASRFLCGSAWASLPGWPSVRLAPVSSEACDEK